MNWTEVERLRTAYALPGPDGRGWRVAVEQPEEGPRRIARVVTLLNHALSTSGNHRNFIVLAGRRAGHLLDPRTGRPPDRTERTWALAPSAAQADALSTAFFLMADADIAALCAAHPQLGAALAGPGETLTVHGALQARGAGGPGS